MISLKSTRTALSLSGLVCFALLAASSGCSAAPGSETVTPTAEVIERSTHALTAGSLQWIDGTYAGCQGHVDASAWSLRVSGTAAMTSTALTVTKNDLACQLTVTALQADTLYGTSSPMTMTAAYQTPASAFASGAGPTAFYANAKLSAVSFASNFTVTILYSDNLQSATPSNTATYAQVSSGGDQATVASPDYSADLSGIAVQADINALVTSATGTLNLTAGSNLGETYVIVQAAVGDTFASVDAAYLAAGTPTAMSSSIAAASLLATGDSLPASRTMIIAHMVNGVRAYQVIHMTFNAPG
jgi:hypothetical protein